MPALLLLAAKLLLDQHRPLLKVYAIPCQAKELPFPKPGEKGNFVQIFVGVALDRGEKVCDLGLVQRVYFLPDRSGRLAGIHGI